MCKLTEEEKGLLIAHRMATRKQLDLNQESLLQQAELRAGGRAPELASAFASLILRGWLRLDGDQMILSEAAAELAEELHREESQTGFGEWMTKCERSPAYAEFCRRVYDTPFIQFNMVDRVQLDGLVRHLELNANHSVLDLGCGIGTQAEYLSDTTGARVLGVDFAQAAVQRACERTTSKRQRLDFRLADLNALELPLLSFDFVLAFDTLYFVDDLGALAAKLAELLHPTGKFAAFYSETQRSMDPPSILEPRATRLGVALGNHGYGFEWVEYTSEEQRVWARSAAAAAALRTRFEAEGNRDLWHSRDEEARHCLQTHAANLTRRYLYLAVRSEPLDCSPR